MYANRPIFDYNLACTVFDNIARSVYDDVLYLVLYLVEAVKHTKSWTSWEGCIGLIWGCGRGAEESYFTAG
jgi:hypothetical protein